MLARVNSIELPNELSTCDCAAKCITVSTRSEVSRYVTRSAEQMSPCTKRKLALSATQSRLRMLAQ